MKPQERFRPITTLWEWQQHAACRGAGSSYFYSPQGERGSSRRAREERALAICAGCPVREPCAAFALAGHEDYGVWGGMTEGQRRELLAPSAGSPRPARPDTGPAARPAGPSPQGRPGRPLAAANSINRKEG